jgi:hypothetical protein
MRWFAASAFALLVVSANGQTWPVTRAEKSNYQETSHYEDVVRFLQDLKAAGGAVTLQNIGVSTEGKPIPLAIASIPPVASAAEARKLGKPIVYIQANIHAGEVEGKEAAMIVLRRLLQDGQKGLLGKMVLLVAPIYNIDGNEKFGPVERNRPEQDGPLLVGLRPNGQGLDLNRDAIKAEAPETRAVLEHVYKEWEPDLMMDLHTTDGTRHGYELTYAPPLNPDTAPEIFSYSRDKFLPSIRRELIAKFGMQTFDYGNTERRQGKDRAWYTFGQEGRYCTNYVGLRSRISALSEATTFIPFHDRVVGTDRFVTAILNYTADHAKAMLAMERAADTEVVSWGKDPSKAPPLGVRFDFASRGSEDVLIEHPQPAGETPNTGRPKSVDKIHMPVFDRFKATKTASFPAAYIIAPGEKDTIALLRRHGIVVEKLAAPWQGPIDRFTVSARRVANNPFQGHRLIQLDGSYARSLGNVDPGYYVVHTAQPLGILAFHILEPESDDGAIAWGFLGMTPGALGQFPIAKSFAPGKMSTELVK